MIPDIFILIVGGGFGIILLFQFYTLRLLFKLDDEVKESNAKLAKAVLAVVTKTEESKGATE